MRIISIFFAALLLLSFASDRDNIIEVPFKLVKGYGDNTWHGEKEPWNIVFVFFVAIGIL